MPNRTRRGRVRLAGPTAESGRRRCAGRLAGEAPTEDGVLQLGREKTGRVSERRETSGVLQLGRETLSEPGQTVIFQLGRQAGRAAGWRLRRRGGAAGAPDGEEGTAAADRGRQAARRQEEQQLPERNDERHPRAVHDLLGLVQGPGGEEGRPVRRSQEHQKEYRFFPVGRQTVRGRGLRMNGFNLYQLYSLK